MFTKKITRKEFLKSGFLGILAILVLPFFKMLGTRDKVSRKEAKYYKNLAG